MILPFPQCLWSAGARLVSLKTKAVTKLIIPSDARKGMKQALHRYGIHRSFIFPDFEGLASHPNWLKFDKY
jgi:hypothetical protein